MFAGKKSAQIREILISESAWEEMTCLFAPSLTTIGLSAKNAILIVEFAKDLMEKEGKGVVEATLMAVRMRLRPILMTSLAFILGVLPLAISNGAGSGAQNAVGIGVMGGMVSATLLAIFFVPVFFVVIRRCFKG